MSTVAAIIPALNEAKEIAATLDCLLTLSPPPAEILVVDGGSTDETITLAKRRGVPTVEAPVSQRAAQMNLGARRTTAEILWFLHADTLPPVDAIERIDQAMRNPRVVGGAFARRFRRSSRFLQLSCRLAGLRCRVNGWFLGDQAIFARRTAFIELDGFPPYDRFEDLELARRLRRHGRTVLLDPPVLSSARRFERRGPIRQTLFDCQLALRYLSTPETVIWHRPETGE